MKLSLEDKIQIVKDHESLGTKETARKWGIHITTVKRIVAKNRVNPLLIMHSSNNKYSFEFKLKAVKAYINGEGGLDCLSVKFGIKAHTTLLNWYHIYQSKGIEGLRNMKKHDRPSKNGVKKTKSAINMDEILNSDRPLTLEEQKALKEHVRFLQCQDDFLKKFAALVSEEPENK